MMASISAAPSKHCARSATGSGADDDLQPFYALAEADPPFWALVQRLYGYHQVRFFTPFENTCWAILGQRTPFAVARPPSAA